MKVMQYPEGTLEEFRIGSGKMPKWQQKILTSTGALMFYTKIREQQFGCVRMIETDCFDENGRKCYYNVAFAESAGEDQKVWKILNYARMNYQEFLKDIHSILYYQGADYLVNKEELIRMCEKAQAEEYEQQEFSETGFLVPEGRVEDFFLNTQVPVKQDHICIVEKQEEVKVMQTMSDTQNKLTDDKLSQMKLFFYCSSPSKGFYMKKISALTGEVLLEGKEATDAMPENAFALTTRSGAQMALYDTSNGLCFVAKDIRSTKADRYGRIKYANIAFEVPREQRLMLTQFAAWALLDFLEFSVSVTDCISVYDGPRGYEVDIEKLNQLFARFENKIHRIPIKYQKVWQQVTNDNLQKNFKFLVVEISMNYFRDNTRLSLGSDQIAHEISGEKVEQWKKDPLKLEFTEEIYVEEPKDEKRIESKEIFSQGESIDTNESQEKVEEKKTSKGIEDFRGKKGEDFIDLLDEKWFLPVAICGVIALVAVAFFLLKKLL